MRPDGARGLNRSRTFWLTIATVVGVVLLLAIVGLFAINGDRPRNELAWKALRADRAVDFGSYAAAGRALDRSGYVLVRSEAAVRGSPGWRTVVGGGDDRVLARLADAVEPIQAVIVGDCHNASALVVGSADVAAAPRARQQCDGSVSACRTSPSSQGGWQAPESRS